MFPGQPGNKSQGVRVVDPLPAAVPHTDEQTVLDTEFFFNLIGELYGWMLLGKHIRNIGVLLQTREETGKKSCRNQQENNDGSGEIDNSREEVLHRNSPFAWITQAA